MPCGQEGNWTLLALGLMVTNSWGLGEVTFRASVWPPHWEPSGIFAEVVQGREVQFGDTQTHCWEPCRKALSTLHLADGVRASTESLICVCQQFPVPLLVQTSSEQELAGK